MLPLGRVSCRRQRGANPPFAAASTEKSRQGTGQRGWHSARALYFAALPAFMAGITQKHSHLHRITLSRQDVQGAPFRERKQPRLSPIISTKKYQRPPCPETRGMKPRGVISITLSASIQRTNSLFSESDRLPGEQIHPPGISGPYHIIPLIKQSSSRLKPVRFLPR